MLKKTGRLNGKIGINGFISSMIRDQKNSEDSRSQASSSRSGIRKRQVGPLTKLGDEDAVSEASSKLEQSSSEDASGSSC